MPKASGESLCLQPDDLVTVDVPRLVDFQALWRQRQAMRADGRCMRHLPQSPFNWPNTLPLITSWGRFAVLATIPQPYFARRLARVR
jgi:hypothetical protein